MSFAKASQLCYFALPPPILVACPFSNYGEALYWRTAFAFQRNPAIATSSFRSLGHSAPQQWFHTVSASLPRCLPQLLCCSLVSRQLTVRRPAVPLLFFMPSDDGSLPREQFQILLPGSTPCRRKVDSLHSLISRHMPANVHFILLKTHTTKRPQ